MTEPALNRVDALTSLLEACNQLRDVVRVPVSQAQLTILILTANSIYEALLADEEAEVIPTGDSLNLDLITERHLHWQGNLRAKLLVRPGVGITVLTASKSQIATGRNRRNLELLL